MEHTDRQIWPLPFTDPPTLDLRAWFSAIELVPLGPGETPVLMATHPRSSGLTVEVHEDAGTVRVNVGPPSFGWPPWHHGKQSFKLILPSHVRARVHSDAGQLRAERFSGCDLNLSTGAGQILVHDLHGRLSLRADAGQIRGDGLRGTFQVESSAGEVRLGIDALDPGVHRIRSNMGAVRLELAEGMRVRVDARTTMGSTRNRYPSTADADIVLSLETDLGSVRIDPGGPVPAVRVDDWRQRWADQAWASSGAAAPSARASAPERPAVAVSEDELKRILTLVEQGKINAQQAGQLIRAMEGR